MEEVLSWFEDEKVRRTKLLASRQHQSKQSGHQFPPSPARTTTSGLNSTATSSMTQFASTPGTFSQLQDMFSTPLVLPEQSLSVPVRSKRGRPAKSLSSTALDSPSPESKRQKTSTEYPCPDCGKSFAPERWSEHVKRVHFPDQVWECQKTNEKTGKVCGSKPFFRPDNFRTHLKSEHGCSDPEITQLKATCKFRVMNFFHQICGLCDEFLVSRDESIEHIKCHFREISQRFNPPEDLGASEWKEKCGSDHKLKRGVHYHVNKNENGDVSDRDRDRDDDGGPSQDGPDNQSHDNSHHQPDKSPNPDRDGGSTDGSSFCSSQASSHMEYRRYSISSSHSCAESAHDNNEPSMYSCFRLKGFTRPFNSLRKLGSGGHGLVDGVVSTVFREIYARKSVKRKHAELTTSSQMVHLKNELGILKELSRPHLVKLIGAYSDAEYSHIIITPVADQNLADYMRSSQLSQPQHLLQWMGCLTSAMAYLHSQQVQHLDVKPQKILVKGHNILLADFGTAKSFFEDSGDLKKLAMTPMYCAPETMLHGRQDYSTDMFSLGCVFSEMITRYFGRSLQEFKDFRSKTGNTAFYLTISETQDWVQQLPQNVVPNPPILHEPGWPTEVLPKIMDMLAEMPTDRPKAKDTHAFFAIVDQCRCSSCHTTERNTLCPTIRGREISQKPIAISNITRSDCYSTDQQHPFPSLYTLPRAPSLSSDMSSIQESDLGDRPYHMLSQWTDNNSNGADFSTSSTMGSPRSIYGDIVLLPDLAIGLGINPSIVEDGYNGFAPDFSYTTSSMEHELALTKSHVLVGECPKVSESSPSVSTFVPSNPTGMMGSLLDRHGSDKSTLRSTQPRPPSRHLIVAVTFPNLLWCLHLLLLLCQLPTRTITSLLWHFFFLILTNARYHRSVHDPPIYWCVSPDTHNEHWANRIPALSPVFPTSITCTIKPVDA